ncbi:MAG: sigma-70 family RNA polymerase sigma factor [Pseudomonadota bacterium]|nr:sigma-70 family RNA polymerase sigma factor [Pseudomonadota bacterium]
MSGAALERVFREASGRIVGALAARFRDLALAEDVFSEACARALEDWPAKGIPTDPAAWLYRVAARAALDGLRRRRTHTRFESQLSAEFDAQPADVGDDAVIPDERLRLIFICCHPAVGVDARAALTLRLVCGLSTLEIARAFLVSETTMAQRLTRAKGKIADAGVPFELPAAQCWPERLDAVLATVEIAYGKAHEDAAASGIHAHFAAEMLELTSTLVQLMPCEAEPAAVAAMVRLAEARRPARIDSSGLMVPLSEQDPQRWKRPLIEEAIGYLNRASALGPDTVRVIQAEIHAAWCSRHTLESPPPWPQVLSLYDALLTRRDDPVVRLNRVVAVAEVHGLDSALLELESLDGQLLRDFAPYHAVRADLLRRAGHTRDALRAYDEALSRIESDAERRWLTRQRSIVLVPQC